MLNGENKGHHFLHTSNESGQTRQQVLFSHHSDIPFGEDHERTSNSWLGDLINQVHKGNNVVGHAIIEPSNAPGLLGHIREIYFREIDRWTGVPDTQRDSKVVVTYDPPLPVNSDGSIQSKHSNAETWTLDEHPPQ